MSNTRAITITIAILIAVVIISVLSYLGYWWLAKDTTERSGQVRGGSYERQTSLVTGILDYYRDIQNPNLPDQQKQAIINEVCVDYNLLTDAYQDNLPFEVIDLINEECF